MSRHTGLAVPDAWPALMTRAQASAYLGVCAETFAKICRVAPLDLGANVLRWPRAGIDAWIATVPPRLSAKANPGDTPPAPVGDELEWAEARRRAQRRAEQYIKRRKAAKR